MGIQFQRVADVAPLLGRDFGVSLADIGLLDRIVFHAGIALACPGARSDEGSATRRRCSRRAAVVLACPVLLWGINRIPIDAPTA
jgi:hypothetical protein